MTRQQWAQLAGVVLLVAALVIISVSVGVPGVSRLRGDFAQFGIWAGVVYAGLYAAVSLAPLPAAVFTLAAGALFGVTEGLQDEPAEPCPPTRLRPGARRCDDAELPQGRVGARAPRMGLAA